MPKIPLVSVIVATKNEEARLPRLLLSLVKQTHVHQEIIVVDNFSIDKTRDIAKQYTKYVYTSGDERSQQRNVGARKARGDYVLFLDADMELPETVIEECVETIVKKKGVAVIIPETNTAKTFFGRIKKLEKQLYLGEPSIETPRFFPKKLFLEVGGYNEHLIAGEDWDIGNRIKSLGTILRIKTPLIHHEDSFIRELKHKWYYAKKIKQYKKIHKELFLKQSGIHRLHLFFRKKIFYTTDPIASAGLIIVKAIEYCIYTLVSR